MVAEGGDLISDPFEGIAEPTAIDDESARDGGALGLVAIEMDVHIKENVLRQLLSIRVSIDVNSSSVFCFAHNGQLVAAVEQ